jgi:hypothetical protein
MRDHKDDNIFTRAYTECKRGVANACEFVRVKANSAYCACRDAFTGACKPCKAQDSSSTFLCYWIPSDRVDADDAAYTIKDHAERPKNRKLVNLEIDTSPSSTIYLDTEGTAYDALNPVKLNINVRKDVDALVEYAAEKAVDAALGGSSLDAAFQKGMDSLDKEEIKDAAILLAAKTFIQSGRDIADAKERLKSSKLSTPTVEEVFIAYGLEAPSDNLKASKTIEQVFQDNPSPFVTLHMNALVKNEVFAQAIKMLSAQDAASVLGSIDF